jgi:hypothetical protein
LRRRFGDRVSRRRRYLVEVVADVTVAGAPDAKLEKNVTKLGREAGVLAVIWKNVPTTDEEREQLPES